MYNPISMMAFPLNVSYRTTSVLFILMFSQQLFIIQPHREKLGGGGGGRKAERLCHLDVREQAAP